MFRTVLAAFLFLAGCRLPGERFVFEHPAMGTTFRIVLYDPDEAHAERAAHSAFACIDALDAALSDYRETSELSLLGQASDTGAPTAPTAVSEDLWNVLAASEDVARASGGAFDVTVGPLVALWRRARRQGECPSAERLDAARAAVGFERIERLEGRRVRLRARGMRLDVGGIAKGYALDRALAVLESEGVECALLDGGGDLLAGAAPPGSRGWHVQVVGLSPGDGECLLLAHAALTTSGDLERFFEVDGRRYSHVIDPRTGQALVQRRLVSVHGPTATTADAWATALSVLGPPGMALLEARPGLSARVVERREEAGRDEVFRSEAFPGRLSCAHSPPRISAQ